MVNKIDALRYYKKITNDEKLIKEIDYVLKDTSEENLRCLKNYIDILLHEAEIKTNIKVQDVVENIKGNNCEYKEKIFKSI